MGYLVHIAEQMSPYFLWALILRVCHALAVVSAQRVVLEAPGRGVEPLLNITVLQTVPFHLRTAPFVLVRLHSRYFLVNDALTIRDTVDIGFLLGLINSRS